MYEQHRQTHCRNEHKLLHCGNCPGKFVWLENLKKHNCITKVLEGEKSPSDIVIKSNTNEICLSPKTIIRCGLCDIIFEKMCDLRQHMPLHADGETGVDFNGCIYVNQFENLSRNRELLQQKIKNAFTQRQISQLYQAIDKYGNEMDISDSDSDDDGETSYLCELCHESFKRRKLLFSHQKEHHRDASKPFSCNDCNMQYVSNSLLQQHLKRECWNEHRRIAEQCGCCKERFIWTDNMLRHKEIQRYKNIENSLSKDAGRTQANNVNSNSSTSNSLPPSANIQIYYCFLCPTTFYSTDQFNDHLARHRITSSTLKTIASTVHSTWWPNGKKIIQCKVCDQVFSTMAKLNEHYSPKNPNNLCASMRRSLENYSITNQIGFELHLELDSETETECIENEENNKILPYRCCMCSKSFKRKYQISQHQRSMHNYELLELKCERCFFRTVSQQVLDYHKISQCFNDEKKYQCDQCNFKFMWQDNLKKHISIFHPSNIFVKSLDAGKANTLNKHRQIKSTGGTNAQCVKSEEDCQNALAAALQKIDSVSRDCNESQYKSQCLICGIYVTQQDCTEHMRRHKCDKSYKCDLCEMSFLTISSLKKHKHIDHEDLPFKCTVCEKSFKQQAGLRVHELLHTGEQPYRCTICSKLFRQWPHLASHMRCHSVKKPDMSEIEETGDKNSLAMPAKGSHSTDSTQLAQEDVKKQLCPICGVHLSYRTNLKIHIRSHTDERPYKCDLCDKTFHRSVHLNVHRRTHFTERPFKCTICDKSFVRAAVLKAHMRNHTGERPYECAVCQKKFMSSGTLRGHSLTHIGYKPVICEICSRTFKSAAYLKSHCIKSGHRAENY